MYKKHFIILLLTLVVLGCKTEEKKEGDKAWRTKKLALENETHNQLLDVEKEAGWQLLFDGKTLNGWHLYNEPGTESAWEVRNGELYCNATDESKKQGDLVTDLAYGNYELTMEWKISGRGNSGIFINVQERPELGTAWQTGPEYQILDPNHMDHDVAVKKSGCLYAFSPQENEADTKSGQWNQTRIKQVDGKVEFYLNGTLTATQDFTAPEWQQKVAATHFKNYPEFGKHTKGKIALQDWYFEVWFRNIKIREL